VLQRPAVVSHGVDEPDLFSRFVWDGCRDYAAALSIPAVVKYWEGMGVNTVRREMKEKLKQGIYVLADRWHPDHAHPDTWAGRVTLTRFDDDKTSSGCLSPMALVALPFSEGKTSTDAKKLQDALHELKVEAPVKLINGRLYVRVSCHIYNHLDDFERLAYTVSRLR
jgi:selenocysteine lyase/cysteine desulfurase